MGDTTYIRDANAQSLAAFLADKLSARLAAGRVIWLLSGGSAIDLAVAARARLSGSLKNLTVSLADERFGPVGHPNSNWQQLSGAGFDFSGLDSRPILTGKDLVRTIKDFQTFLGEVLASGGCIIGLLGIGTDGHTAGILPHSPAINSAELATSYSGPDYQRITVTPQFIRRLDEAYLYAMGEAKFQQVERLGRDLPMEEQPAQVLKQVKDLTIFSDSKGVGI